MEAKPREMREFVLLPGEVPPEGACIVCKKRPGDAASGMCGPCDNALHGAPR